MHPNLEPFNPQGDKVSDKHSKITMLMTKSIELSVYLIESK